LGFWGWVGGCTQVRGDGSLALGPGPGGDGVGAAMPPELATSGRGCFRCATRAIERAPTRHKVYTKIYI
jgi:hypothetical protein